MSDQPPFYPDLLQQVRKIASRGRMDDADVQIIFDAADAIQRLEGSYVQQQLIITNLQMFRDVLKASVAERDVEIKRLQGVLGEWTAERNKAKNARGVHMSKPEQKIENLLLTPEEQVILHDDLRRMADERKTRLLGRVPLIARFPASSSIQQHKANMELLDAVGRSDYAAMMAESINDRKDEAIRSE